MCHRPVIEPARGCKARLCVRDTCISELDDLFCTKADVFSWTNLQGAVHFMTSSPLQPSQTYYDWGGFWVANICTWLLTCSSWNIKKAFIHLSAAARAPLVSEYVLRVSLQSLCNQFDEKTMHWKIKLQVASILIRFMWCHFNWKYILCQSDEIIWDLAYVSTQTTTDMPIKKNYLYTHDCDCSCDFLLWLYAK